MTEPSSSDSKVIRICFRMTKKARMKAFFWEQVRRYLKPPSRRFRIAGWDGEQIAVDLSADRHRARTGVLVDFQESGSQLIQTSKVVFNWVSSDETCDAYHLVPLD